MIRRWTALLAGMLAAALVLSACGSDDKDGVRLKEIYTNPATGVTIRYPEGWVVRPDAVGIETATSVAALDADRLTTADLRGGVMVLPLDAMGVTDLESAVKMLMDVFITPEQSSQLIGAVTDITIGSRPAKRLLTRDTAANNDQLIVLLLTEDGTQLIFVAGTTIPGSAVVVEPYTRAIAESVKAAPPPAQ